MPFFEIAPFKSQHLCQNTIKKFSCLRTNFKKIAVKLKFKKQIRLKAA